MSKTTFVRVATVVFTIVGLGHLYRAINSLPVDLVGWAVPVGLSWVAAAFALYWAYNGYRHWH